MAEGTGKDYVARETLYNRTGTVIAVVGQTCERVPATSLPWLLEGGHIAFASTPPDGPTITTTPPKPTRSSRANAPASDASAESETE